MYLYFNNQGVLTTILEHGGPVLTQGSSNFQIKVLFEDGCPYTLEADPVLNVDSLVSIKFKKPGEKNFGVEKFLTGVAGGETFHKLDGEDSFDLVDGGHYKVYTYTLDTEDTAKYGNMEAVVTIYRPIIVDMNNDNAIDRTYDAFGTEVFSLGLVMLYVQKTIGNGTSSLVSLTEYNYLLTLIGILYNTVTGGSGTVKTGNVEIYNKLTMAANAVISGDLIPDVDDTQHIGKSDKNWADLWLTNGKISIGPNDNLKVNDYDYKHFIEMLNTEVFGLSTGQENENGLKYIIRNATNGLDGRLVKVENEIGTQQNPGSSTLRGRMATAENDIDNIENEIGEDNQQGTVKGRVKTLETAVGEDNQQGTVKGRIKALETAVGEDNQQGTVKGRVKVLENDNETNKENITTLQEQRPGFIILSGSASSLQGTSLTSAQKNELNQPDCVVKWTDENSIVHYCHRMKNYNASNTDHYNFYSYDIHQSANDFPYNISYSIVAINQNGFINLIGNYNLTVLSPTHVINSFDSEAANKPLSALKGKELRDLITGIVNDIGSYSDPVSNGTIKAKISDLQEQIDGINAGQNLVDMVGLATDLANYNAQNLLVGDKVQVLKDSNYENASTVYNWIGNGTAPQGSFVITNSRGKFVYIGKYGQDGYTKAEEDALLDLKADKATTYTKIETDNTFVKQADVVAVTNEEIDLLFA